MGERMCVVCDEPRDRGFDWCSEKCWSQQLWLFNKIDKYIRGQDNLFKSEVNYSMLVLRQVSTLVDPWKAEETS